MPVNSRKIREDFKIQREIEEEIQRNFRLQQIQNRLTELHERLEPDLNEAKNNGVSLTEWRMISKLERNERQRQEIRKEYVRVLARNLASPIEEQRGFLLDAYLDKVVSGMVYK